MIATHIDYKHPKHLGVNTNQKFLCSSGSALYYTNYLCVAPGSALYKQLYKSNLPSAISMIWDGQKFVQNPKFKLVEPIITPYDSKEEN